jgi:hypothetical protein
VDELAGVRATERDADVRRAPAGGPEEDEVASVQVVATDTRAQQVLLCDRARQRELAPVEHESDQAAAIEVPRSDRRTTGLPISAVLEAGLAALRDQLRAGPPEAPFEVFASLDPGPGGCSVAASTETKAGVRAALDRKHRRG